MAFEEDKSLVQVLFVMPTPIVDPACLESSFRWPSQFKLTLEDFHALL